MHTNTRRFLQIAAMISKSWVMLDDLRYALTTKS
jgi:hypothetical protein